MAMMLAVAALSASAALRGQESRQKDESATPSEREPRREAGGRIVVPGETVVVAGEPDAVPRTSSIATKSETRLLETPRSVSIVDRQTLDDAAVVNITQAHDYTVGVTPQDERGPAFARGFPVDFYDLRRDGLRTYSWSAREPVALDRLSTSAAPLRFCTATGVQGGWSTSC